MSETFLRQWAMMRLVPRAPRKIATSLMQQRLLGEGFDVNLRTIQRDLKSLSVIFPLISDERDKPFGWSWAGHDVFDIPGMDPPTALTFSLVEQFLEPVLPRSGLDHLRPHFSQARHVLKDVANPRLGRWLDKVRLLSRNLKLIPAEVDVEALDTVYEALLTDKRFSAVYRRRGEDTAQEYEVNPLGLVFFDEVIYLVCTLWDYGDIKQLALHRFQAVSLSEKRRTKPKGFNLDDYIQSGEFDYLVTTKKIKLDMLMDKTAAEKLFETPLSEEQTLREQADGRMRVKAAVDDTEQLRWWLQGYGAQVEIIGPKKLRQEFVAMSCALADLYSN